MKINQIIIINSCLILIMGLLSIDLYNPALPEMAKVLKVTDAQIQSLVFYYLMGFSLSQLIYGPISDKKGRVPVIIFSLTVAAIAHFLTFFAKSFSTLSILRTLTGLAAGGCPVISRAILSDTFKNKIELSKALTIFSMASQVSPAFAPIIGVYISTYLKWNYNFLILSILISIATLFVKYTLKETNTTSKSSRNTFSNFKILLQDSKFITYSVISAILFAITIGYFTASPFIIQNEYRLSAKLNGYLFFYLLPRYCYWIIFNKKITQLYLPRGNFKKLTIFSLFYKCFNFNFEFSARYYFNNLLFGLWLSYCTGVWFSIPASTWLKFAFTFTNFWNWKRPTRYLKDGWCCTLTFSFFTCQHYILDRINHCFLSNVTHMFYDYLFSSKI